MMQGEKIASDLREAQDAVSGNHSPVRHCPRSAPAGTPGRKLARAGRAGGEGDRCAINALEEADQHLARRWWRRISIPPSFERIEERLFSLRGASRKYSTPVDGLAALAAKYAADVALIDAGADRLKKLEAQRRKRTGSTALPRPNSPARAPSRRRSSTRRSMPNWRRSKLERAKFRNPDRIRPNHRARRVSIASSSGSRPNPGTKAGPLMKVASGGELSRFLLALKVVLSDRGSAPTLVSTNRHRRRRCRGRRHWRPPGAARGQGAGDGGDPCAAGRRAASQHLLISKDALDKGKRVATASTRSPPITAARKSPACWRRRDYRRSPRRRRAALTRGDGVTAPSPRLRAACGRGWGEGLYHPQGLQ